MTSRDCARRQGIGVETHRRSFDEHVPAPFLLSAVPAPMGMWGAGMGAMHWHPFVLVKRRRRAAVSGDSRFFMAHAVMRCILNDHRKDQLKPHIHAERISALKPNDRDDPKRAGRRPCPICHH
jgi:hypothetical protein